MAGVLTNAVPRKGKGERGNFKFCRFFYAINPTKLLSLHPETLYGNDHRKENKTDGIGFSR